MSSHPLPPLGRINHNLVFLQPVNKLLVHRQPAVNHTGKKWSDETEEALKDWSSVMPMGRTLTTRPQRAQDQRGNCHRQTSGTCFVEEVLSGACLFLDSDPVAAPTDCFYCHLHHSSHNHHPSATSPAAAGEFIIGPV